MSKRLDTFQENRHLTKEERIEEERKKRAIWEQLFNPNPEEKFIWWCPKCKVGILRRNEEGDFPFSEDEFGGEGYCQSWKCDRCGFEEIEPID